MYGNAGIISDVNEKYLKVKFKNSVKKYTMFILFIEVEVKQMSRMQDKMFIGRLYYRKQILLNNKA